MLNFLRENRYRQGCCDRDAGLLPRTQDKVYLDGYFKGRPEGLDTLRLYTLHCSVTRYDYINY